MKQKLTMLAASLAVGFLLAGPAAAGADKQGGGSGAPPGMGSDWGGSDGCNSSCGGHDKNGGGGHNKNGGGGGMSGGGGGGSNTNDSLRCVVGDQVFYVSSVRHCRRLNARYSYGVSYGYGEGYGNGYGGGYGYGYREPSYATRMQVRKRARQAYGNGQSYRKVHSGKRHGRRVARRGYGGGKNIIVNNYGGAVVINKNGGY